MPDRRIPFLTQIKQGIRDLPIARMEGFGRTHSGLAEAASVQPLYVYSGRRVVGS